MKYLWNEWDIVQKTIAGRNLIVFLDYDGTLAPIASRPGLAQLPFVRKVFLRSLLKVKGMSIAIVSGRQLTDIKRLVGVPQFLYAGNHGLEFEGPRIRFVHPKSSGVKKMLSQLTKTLEQALGPFPGIFVENKGLGLSVHYRELSDFQIEEARSVFHRILKPYLKTSKAVITTGKKVWEVRIRTRWDKGAFVAQVLSSFPASVPPVFPIYIGDDQTDEDAFQVLRRKGIGIKVADHPHEPSAARYFLHSPAEVYQLLKSLKTLRTKRKKEHVSVGTV